MLYDLDIVVFAIDFKEFKVSIVGNVIFHTGECALVRIDIVNSIVSPLTPQMRMSTLKTGLGTSSKSGMTEESSDQSSAVGIVFFFIISS
jgi:hypothetical protein